MARTTSPRATSDNKPRRLPSSLLLAAAYSLGAVLILQAVTCTAADRMETTNTMDDASDMIEDFAREVMRESTFNL
jgi:hypothetical protein